MIQQANYMGIVVDDLDAATTFYRDTLGVPVNEEAGIPGAYVQFDLEGGAVLSLQAQTALAGNPPFEPALMVEDADAAYTAWKERGVELLEEPNDMPFGRTFTFRTPAGHVLRAYAAPRG